MKSKVSILASNQMGATDIPGEEAGFWKVWGSSEGLFMTQNAYNTIKKHFQQIKFRPGDTIQNCKEPGELLIVVDHNHTDYFCIDSFGKNVNFPFHEAQELTEPVDKWGFKVGDTIVEKGKTLPLTILSMSITHYEVSTTSGMKGLVRKEYAEQWAGNSKVYINRLGQPVPTCGKCFAVLNNPRAACENCKKKPDVIEWSESK